jgi:hypothetical protein
MVIALAKTKPGEDLFGARLEGIVLDRKIVCGVAPGAAPLSRDPPVAGLIASCRMVSSPAGVLSWGRKPTVVPRCQVRVPSSGESSPRMILNRVVLPAPFAPTSPKRSPLRMVNATSSNRVRVPKCLARLATVSMETGKKAEETVRRRGWDVTKIKAAHVEGRVGPVPTRRLKTLGPAGT